MCSVGLSQGQRHAVEDWRHTRRPAPPPSGTPSPMPSAFTVSFTLEIGGWTSETFHSAVRVAFLEALAATLGVGASALSVTVTYATSTATVQDTRRRLSQVGSGASVRIAVQVLVEASGEAIQMKHFVMSSAFVPELRLRTSSSSVLAQLMGPTRLVTVDSGSVHVDVAIPTPSPTPIECGAGKYRDPAHAECHACAPGSFNDHANAGTCTPCASGRHQTSFGATSCDVCPVGHFQPVPGSSSCNACSVGQFQARDGATGCETCSVGRFQPHQGATSCSACPTAMYGINSVVKSSVDAECALCPAGRSFLIVAGTTGTGVVTPERHECLLPCRSFCNAGDAACERSCAVWCEESGGATGSVSGAGTLAAKPSDQTAVSIGSPFSALAHYAPFFASVTLT